MSICPHCGHEEEIGPLVPPGCQCDPGTWWPNPIGPVCDSHKGDSSMQCEECEHDFACHGGGGE